MAIRAPDGANKIIIVIMIIIIMIMVILVVLTIWVCSLRRLHTVWERTLNYTQVSLKIKIINHNYKKK